MSRPLHTRRAKRARCRGVTRFELLVGTGVLAAIVTVVAFASGVERRGTKRSDAVQAARVVLSAAETWQREQQLEGCPTLSQLLEDDVLEESAEMGDPWGSRFRIRCDETLSVESAGEDGRLHTQDDVRVVGD